MAHRVLSGRWYRVHVSRRTMWDRAHSFEPRSLRFHYRQWQFLCGRFLPLTSRGVSEDPDAERCPGCEARMAELAGGKGSEDGEAVAEVPSSGRD
jgi:hypothetical protein